MSVLVVGRNSLIARAISAVRQDWTYVPHTALDSHDLLDGVTCIVNCALNPALRQGAYDPALDIDLQLAKRAADAAVPYVMLSTRKVYAPKGEKPLHEDDPLGPVDAYGRNKLETEIRLKALLGDRLTILRIANVIAFETGEGRASFMRSALTRLLNEGRIIFDVSPDVPRDFVPLEDVARTIVALVERNVRGVFNVGSGHAIPVGDIARWIVDGFGSGVIHSTQERYHDPFVLDVRRVEQQVGTICTQQRVEAYCRALGEHLRALRHDRVSDSCSLPA